MSNSFGTPNTQSGFTLGTATQPAGGRNTGFSFGAATVGAGDANKAATPALAQATAQTQAKSYVQPFASNFTTPKFGGTPTGTPTFGATPLATSGYGTPASATTGFSMSQPASTAGNIVSSSSQAIPGSVSFGTPIGATTAQITQPLQLGFQTPASQTSGLSITALSAPSSTPSFNFGPNTTAPTTSALAFNLGGSTTISITPVASGISFGASKSNVIGTSVGSAAPTSGGLSSLSFGPSGIGGTQAPTSATGFNITGAAPQALSSTGSAPAGSTPAASTAGGFSLSGSQTQTAQITGTGFNLGGIATSTPGSAAATGFSLGTPASSTAFALGSTAPTTAASAFNLSGTSTTASPGFSLGKSASTPASTAPQTSAPQTSLGTTTNVTSSTVVTSQAGGLNFCQLEESINKWTLELEEQEKAFVNQATQVNAWDRLLIANGEKIVTLNQEVERVKLEQQQLEHELDYVVGQQRELQDCLVPLEKELAAVSASDPEREYTYRLAENLDTQLKQMSEDLKEIIDHLNEANRSQDSSDPIVQIGKILNAHMNSLQWLDQRTAVLQTKIQQIDQLHQNFRQEHERSFNLAYN